MTIKFFELTKAAVATTVNFSATGEAYRLNF